MLALISASYCVTAIHQISSNFTVKEHFLSSYTRNIIHGHKKKKNMVTTNTVHLMASSLLCSVSSYFYWHIRYYRTANSNNTTIQQCVPSTQLVHTPPNSSDTHWSTSLDKTVGLQQTRNSFISAECLTVDISSFITATDFHTKIHWVEHRISWHKCSFSACRNVAPQKA